MQLQTRKISSPAINTLSLPEFSRIVNSRYALNLSLNVYHGRDNRNALAFMGTSARVVQKPMDFKMFEKPASASLVAIVQDGKNVTSSYLKKIQSFETEPYHDIGTVFAYLVGGPDPYFAIHPIVFPQRPLFTTDFHPAPPDDPAIQAKLKVIENTTTHVLQTVRYLNQSHRGRLESLVIPAIGTPGDGITFPRNAAQMVGAILNFLSEHFEEPAVRSLKNITLLTHGAGFNVACQVKNAIDRLL